MITLQVGVKVLLKNSEGKYLLVRRSPKKYPEAASQWDIVGGRIDPGSALLDNLRREVKEETGLEVKGMPKLIAAQDIIPNAERHTVRLTYVGEADGEPVLNEEHNEFGWFTLEEIGKLENLDKYFKQLLEDGALQPE